MVGFYTTYPRKRLLTVHRRVLRPFFLPVSRRAEKFCVNNSKKHLTKRFMAEEINRIGVNINQIVHRVNSTDALSITGMIMPQNNMADLYSIIRKEFVRYGK